ncbi:MAG: hypothetical protein MZV65_41240 [Chromatiales bacterium]|nr:hypothetical protein [Chromatiales bacterium]
MTELAASPLMDALLRLIFPLDAATWLAFGGAPVTTVLPFWTFARMYLLAMTFSGWFALQLDASHAAIPQAVAKYTTLLTDFIISHDLLPSLHQLYSERQDVFTPEQAERLQGLDAVAQSGHALC